MKIIRIVATVGLLAGMLWFYFRMIIKGERNEKKSAEVHYKQGLTYIKSKEYEKAINNFREASFLYSSQNDVAKVEECIDLIAQAHNHLKKIKSDYEELYKRFFEPPLAENKEEILLKFW